VIISNMAKLTKDISFKKLLTSIALFYIILILPRFFTIAIKLSTEDGEKVV